MRMLLPSLKILHVLEVCLRVLTNKLYKIEQHV